MSDTPETLSAILAEMRLDADILVFPTLTPDKLRTYADRFEAAYKRERAITDIMLAVKDKPIPHPDPNNAPPLFAAPGNAAAMREALERIVNRVLSIIGSQHVGIIKFGLEEKKRISRAALAAPSRNCDRFQTEEEAYTAFMGLFDHFKGERHYQYCRWLFAPAEGGDHA